MWESEVSLGVVDLSLWQFAILCAVLFGISTWLGTRRALNDCQLTAHGWPLSLGLVGALLTFGFVVCALGYHCQQTPVVRPSPIGQNWRVVYHLVLISLLLVVTATDLRSYYILDWTCWTGIVCGLLGAVVSGEFQLVHVWVDWNQEIPQLSGPYIPPWLAAHQHLHGLAWSSTGLIAGILITWMTKLLSSVVLGINALGTGDIFLMAMIGAFLGWQPTLIAFAIAPLFAVLIGGAIRAVSNQPALPYGPFLAAGALVTIFAWRPIWMFEVPLTLAENPDRDSIFAVRRFFGDWVSMLLSAGLAIGLFVVLLGILRFYKSLDLKKRSDEP